MVITNNLAAMNAQRQFNIVGNRKKKSTEKLSSGYKINRAADDAAGLTISEKMRSQIRGLSQGVENTQDGVSLCQVADGALHEVNDMLHRITELSIKSANETNTDSDRQAIQQEINQLLTEIDRIGDTTEFNEKKLFKGKIDNNSRVENTIESEELLSYRREKAIQASLNISGTTSIETCYFNTIVSEDDAIVIKGSNSGFNSTIKTSTTVSLDEIKNTEGKSIKEVPLQAGKYSFSYNGLEISFEVPNNSSLSEITLALNGTRFGIGGSSSTVYPMEIWGVKTDCDRSFTPTEEGISISNYGTVTWRTLGIDDLSSAAGKSFTYNDETSGFAFSGKIESGMTKDDIINSSSTLVGAVDREQHWYSLIRPQNPSSFYGFHGNNLQGVAAENALTVSGGEVRVLGVVDYLTHGDEMRVLGYDPLGWGLSTMQNITVNATIELLSDDAGNPIARIIDKETGNYCDQGITWFDTPSMSLGSTEGYIVFGDTTGSGGNGAQIKVAISKPRNVTLSETDSSLMNYLGSVGKVASNVTIQKYYYTVTKKGSSRRLSYFPSTASPITPGKLTPPEGSQEDEDDTVSGTLSLWIQSGAKAGDGMYLTIDAMNTKILGINGLDASTVNGALKGIDKVKGALDKVNANRSKIGAQQNRLEHTIANERNIVENTQAAESRIRDTDMAKESANLAIQNILTQAGVAMMSQANQSAQGVLQLLQ